MSTLIISPGGIREAFFIQGPNDLSGSGADAETKKLINLPG